MNSEEIVVAYIRSTGSFIYHLLVKKAPNSWKKSQTSNTQVQYTFDASMIEGIFYFLLKERFITFPHDHPLPNKEELEGKVYYKYHNSWNHGTNSCWSFRNIIHDRINKETLNFHEKKKSMVIDEDPFPPMASVNRVATDIRA